LQYLNSKTHHKEVVHHGPAAFVNLSSGFTFRRKEIATPVGSGFVQKDHSIGEM
jgi:hypothetical protein